MKSIYDMRIHFYRNFFFRSWASFLTILVLTGCANKHQNGIAEVSPGHLKHALKPGSTYQDSLVVNSPAVVFFHADSVQLQKLKSELDDQVYKGSMHEFYYMVRNAHIFLNKNWADLPVIEANKVRYLVFRHEGGFNEVIDLDKEQDPIGMFVFDGKQKPLVIDMTNIDTQVPVYFQANKKAVSEDVR